MLYNLHSFIHLSFSILYYLCRNVQIQFDSVRLLVQFVSSEECRQLCEGNSKLLEFLVEELENSLQQTDLWNRRNSIDYDAANFLYLLSSLCASDDSAVEKLVAVGLVRQIATAINVDRDRLKTDINFKRTVFHALKSLWSVLLASDGKNREIVRKEAGILAGLFHVLFIFYISYTFSSLIIKHNFHLTGQDE